MPSAAGRRRELGDAVRRRLAGVNQRQPPFAAERRLDLGEAGDADPALRASDSAAAAAAASSRQPAGKPRRQP